MAIDANKLSVLLVDDDREVLDSFELNCEDFWQTSTVADPQELQEGEVSLENVDVLILDLIFEQARVRDLADEGVSDTEGFELLEWIREKNPDIPVVILSAVLDDQMEKEISKAFPGVLCLRKPLNFSSSKFRKLLEQHAGS